LAGGAPLGSLAPNTAEAADPAAAAAAVDPAAVVVPPARHQEEEEEGSTPPREFREGRGSVYSQEGDYYMAGYGSGGEVLTMCFATYLTPINGILTPINAILGGATACYRRRPPCSHSCGDQRHGSSLEILGAAATSRPFGRRGCGSSRVRSARAGPSHCEPQPHRTVKHC